MEPPIWDDRNDSSDLRDKVQRSVLSTEILGKSVIPWPNENWKLISRFLSSCQLSDPAAELFLETLRNIDVRVSIPLNVKTLRAFESEHIVDTM